MKHNLKISIRFNLTLHKDHIKKSHASISRG
jgi:hypothetical protein